MMMRKDSWWNLGVNEFLGFWEFGLLGMDWIEIGFD